MNGKLVERRIARNQTTLNSGNSKNSPNSGKYQKKRKVKSNYVIIVTFAAWSDDLDIKPVIDSESVLPSKSKVSILLTTTS